MGVATDAIVHSSLKHAATETAGMSACDKRHGSGDPLRLPIFLNGQNEPPDSEA